MMNNSHNLELVSEHTHFRSELDDIFAATAQKFTPGAICDFDFQSFLEPETSGSTIDPKVLANPDNTLSNDYLSPFTTLYAFDSPAPTPFQSSLPTPTATATVLTSTTILSGPSEGLPGLQTQQQSEIYSGRRAANLYSCSECQFGTSNLKRYGDHMRVEHNLMAFECHICGAKTARYDNLKSHQKRCNPQTAAAKRHIFRMTNPTMEVRPMKRLRVSLKDLPLRPTSPDESEGAGSTIPSLQRNEESNRQSQPEAHLLPDERNSIRLTPNNGDEGSAANIDSASELERVKAELAMVKHTVQELRRFVKGFGAIL